MIRELRAERGNEKMRAHNAGIHYGVASGSGAVPSRDSNKSINSDAGTNTKLDAARAHRDKLLAFQAQNVQRTRVVDEAADFDTPNIASTQWMSPTQRALALKKQQRVLREMEERAQPEWEKTTVMSLDIKGGKVIRTFQRAAAGEGLEDETRHERIGPANRVIE